MSSERRKEDAGSPAPDFFASLTIAIVAVAALVASWSLPWWAMEARAPQYGQRTLIVDVSPVRVGGDVFEIDTLGHYVGIRPMGTLAKFERKLAPFGLVAAIVGMLVAPWLRSRWLRLLVLCPTILLPLIFMVDLNYWMNKSVSERDLDAALNLTVTSVDPRLLGNYELGQFKVTAKVQSGLLLTLVAALIGFGLVFARPLRLGSAHKAAGAGALVVLGLAAPAGAASHRVGIGESLEAAVARAAPGDTLIIAAGSHPSHLRVDRPLRIEGERGAVLDGAGAGTVVDVRAPGVELSGLTIRGSGDSLAGEDAGVRIDHASGTRVVDVRIEDALFGVFVVAGDGTRIERSLVVGKDLPPDRRGDGIRLWYSNNCVLAANVVERSRDVILWYSSDAIVVGNIVRHGRYGLHYMYSDRNVFRDNVFEDNQVGATVMYSRGIELSGNSFSFANGVSAYGLLLKESNDIFARGNRFLGNSTAIFLDDAPQDPGSRLVLEGNLIAHNEVGLAFQPLNRGAEISGNAFASNRTQVEVLGTGSADKNSWSKDGRGNFWSDAVVYDRDGDGVSEIPYRAESTFEALAGRTPALAWFSASPAADAIDGSARLFPIFAPRPRMTDPHPLVASPVAASAGPGKAVPRAGGLAPAGLGLLAMALLGGLAARAVLS